MKNITIFLMVILSLAILPKAEAQVPPPSQVSNLQVLKGFDTTVVSYKDTLKNYAYSNVYMIVTSVNLNRGSSFPIAPASSGQSSSSYENWKASVSVNFYTSKTDYAAGKQSITQANVQLELGTPFPTQEAILTKLLATLPK